MKLKGLIPCAALFTGMLPLAAASGNEERLLPLSLPEQPSGPLLAQTTEKPTVGTTTETSKKKRDSANAAREKSVIDKRKRATEKQADLVEKERRAAKGTEPQATNKAANAAPKAEKTQTSQSRRSVMESPSKQIQEKKVRNRDEKIILPQTSGPRPIDSHGSGGSIQRRPDPTPGSDDPHAPGGVIKRGPDPTPISGDPHVPGGDPKYHANPSGSPGLE